VILGEKGSSGQSGRPSGATLTAYAWWCDAPLRSCGPPATYGRWSFPKPWTIGDDLDERCECIHGGVMSWAPVIHPKLPQDSHRLSSIVSATGRLRDEDRHPSIRDMLTISWPALQLFQITKLHASIVLESIVWNWLARRRKHGLQLCQPLQVSVPETTDGALKDLLSGKAIPAGKTWHIRRIRTANRLLAPWRLLLRRRWRRRCAS
jgi:hypothetical protein